MIAALVEAGRLPRGSHGGPEVGVLLGRLLEQVTDDPASNERDRLLASLRLLIAAPADPSDVSRETTAAECGSDATS